VFNWLKREGPSPTLGFDLGSWRSRVVSAQGLQASCSSAVLWDLSSNDPVELGDRAQALQGRHPAHWTFLRPIRNGLLADFDAAEEMVRRLLENQKGKISALAAAPAMAGEIELQVLAEMLQEAGCNSVCLLPSAACLAVAAAHPPPQYPAVAVLELGYQLMQATVFSRGTAVQQLQVRGGAEELTQRLQEHLLRRHWLAVGSNQLERLLGFLSARPGREDWLEVGGKDLQSGLPRRLMVAAWELDRWVELTLQSILRMITQLLEETPPDLLQVILTQGLFLGGGLSGLNGLQEFLSAHLSLPVHIVEQPELAVARGLSTLLQDEETLNTLVQSQVLAGRLG
jgi:rod shape-determining protein MreB